MRRRNRIVRCSPPFCHPSNSLYIYTFEICDDPLDCLTRGSTACIDLGINQVFTEWSPDTYLRHSIGTAIVDRFVVAKRLRRSGGGGEEKSCCDISRGNLGEGALIKIRGREKVRHWGKLESAERAGRPRIKGEMVGNCIRINVPSLPSPRPGNGDRMPRAFLVRSMFHTPTARAHAALPALLQRDHL